ncbi:hypothetical protein [Nocardioides sp. Soil796]|uniref:hypothetical protein n=1 Tax=Nocardioides sp. Soil796 TaxID=1736412 RepID=UPI000AE8897A|nr:hypothetical protein [Nocardioides sp. Soil796]
MRTTRATPWLMIGAVVVLVAAGVLLWQSRSGDDDAPVDEDLASRITATGVTPYDVRLGKADIDEVRVEAGSVLVDYDHTHEDRHAYTLVLSKAPSGDLCGAQGTGEQDDGSTCTSEDDRMSSTFEEMGSFSLRRDGTLLTLSNLVIESDPGIEERAFTALEAAEPVPADDLARH